MIFIKRASIVLHSISLAVQSLARSLAPSVESLFSSPFAIMFLLKSLSAAIVLSAACVALPATERVDFKSSVVEKLKGPPVGWVKDEAAKLNKDATSVTLKIHLVNQDMDKFHELAMNVR